MRVFGHCAVAGGLAAAVAFSGATALGTSEPTIGSAAQSKDPAAILAAARQALGGEKKLTAVKSFTATGRTRQVRGDNLVPIEFEIFVELPDKYLRKDEMPAQESGPTASGFNGEEFLQDPPPAAPPTASGRRRRGRSESCRSRGRAESSCDDRQAGLRPPHARHVRDILSAYPLTFAYVGEAEAPQGKADVLDAKGPNNFTLRLFVNQQNASADHGELAGPAPGAGADQEVPACRVGRRLERAGEPRLRAHRVTEEPRRPGLHRRVRAVLHLQASVGLQHRLATEARRRRATAVLRLAEGECRPAEVPRARLRPRTGSTSPTTATSTACSSPSGCAAPSGPTPSRKPRSIASRSTRKSTRRRFEVRK